MGQSVQQKVLREIYLDVLLYRFTREPTSDGVNIASNCTVELYTDKQEKLIFNNEKSEERNMFMGMLWERFALCARPDFGTKSKYFKEHWNMYLRGWSNS